MGFLVTGHSIMIGYERDIFEMLSSLQAGWNEDHHFVKRGQI